jgi:hypothetical protein
VGQLGGVLTTGQDERLGLRTRRHRQRALLQPVERVPDGADAAFGVLLTLGAEALGVVPTAVAEGGVPVAIDLSGEASHECMAPSSCRGRLTPSLYPRKAPEGVRKV